ncbi:MAG: T9SS type A sorting domain-containing protein [Saprospiraceae bacterium]|nr:T9SS type A sorting domain-containing protein [Saprospiraceae bacterium]
MKTCVVLIIFVIFSVPLIAVQNFTVNDADDIAVSGYQERSFTAPGYPLITVSRQLFPGWEWISLNVTLEDMSLNNVLASLEESAQHCKSQTQASLFYDDLGWYGSMISINNFELYQISLIEPAIWEVTGLPVDPQSTVYQFYQGWNFISYSPQTPEEINYALANLGNDGNTIHSQTAFADYIPDVGWVGTLNTLEPLAGYKLEIQNATTFTFPLPSDNIFTGSDPEWIHEFDYRAYECNGTMVLSTEDHVLPGKIYALCNGEIRGCSETLILDDVLGRNFYVLMVYGNPSSEEEYTLFYQYPDTKTMYELDYSFIFQPGMKAGNFLFPIIITLPEEEHYELPEFNHELTIFPNPFNPETTINFNLTVQSNIKLDIYNLKGQFVETLVNSTLPAGTHTCTWNPQSTSSGIYFLKAQINDQLQIKKLTLIK